MKLGFLSIFSIGLAIATIILSYTYFWIYEPTMEDAANQENQARLLQKEANFLPRSYKQKLDAAVAVNRAYDDWQKIVATKTPPDNLQSRVINMGVNAWQMVIDVRIFR